MSACQRQYGKLKSVGLPRPSDSCCHLLSVWSPSGLRCSSLTGVVRFLECWAEPQSSDEECTFPISCSLLFEVETDTTGAQVGDAEISVSAARLRVSMTKSLNKGVPSLDKVICAILLAHETLFPRFPCLWILSFPHNLELAFSVISNLYDLV